MTLLLAGLLLFLGTHAIHIVAPRWRAAQIARLGVLPWKGVFALISLIGFVLIVQGYGEARLAPEILWTPPTWTRHAAALLTLPAFVLVVAAYVPGNRIKLHLGHPMVVGVKVWALAHLLANGTLADMILFGAFLAWAVASFAVSRRHDPRTVISRPPNPLARDLATVVVGVVAWGAFAFWLHGLLIGVAPFA